MNKEKRDTTLKVRFQTSTNSEASKMLSTEKFSKAVDKETKLIFNHKVKRK